MYWKSKSQKAGRPPIDIKVQRIVKKMIKENPLWGAPTLHGELIKLGIVVSERTVSNMIKRYRVGNPPSQTWRTFLKNHMNNTYAIDFFTVPTANFKIWNTKPKYLLRDRDGIYGKIFQKRIRNMGIEEVKTAPHSPW